MRKLNILITFIVLASVVLPKAYGQNDKPALESRHSVRIGWGDMITETILFPVPSAHSMFFSHLPLHTERIYAILPIESVVASVSQKW